MCADVSGGHDVVVAMQALRVELTETLAYWTVVDERGGRSRWRIRSCVICGWAPTGRRALPAPMQVTWRAIWSGARSPGGTCRLAHARTPGVQLCG